MNKTNIATKFIYTKLVLVLCLFLLFQDCASLIAKFDPFALDLAETLKTGTLLLMGKAVEPYEHHEKEVAALLLRIELASEYAGTKKKNEICLKQWEILKDPNRNMVAGFIKKWKQKGYLNPLFITEAKKVIAHAFDTIIQLEKGKSQP